MAATVVPERHNGAGRGLPPFRLERWLAEHDAEVRHVACASDVEGWGLHELLWLADGDTRRLWEQMSLGRTHPTGHPLLREEIAHLYDGLGPDDILVTSGAQEAISLLTDALVEPGQHVVVTGPASQALHELPRSRGADVSIMPLEHAQGWRVSRSTFAAALSPRTRLAILNFPHDPTGSLPDQETFGQMLAEAGRNRIRVISDEACRYTELDTADRLPAAADVDDRAVSVGAMSQAFGLTGLRIGWIATRDADVRQRVVHLRDYSTVAAAAPSEILALVALRNADEVLRRSGDIAAAGRRAWGEFFRRWSGTFSWVEPRAGTVAFPRIDRQVPVNTFCEELLRETGVALLPGEVFGDTGNHFRIGFGRRDVPTAVEKLDGFARRWLSAY